MKSVLYIPIYLTFSIHFILSFWNTSFSKCFHFTLIADDYFHWMWSSRLTLFFFKDVITLFSSFHCFCYEVGSHFYVCPSVYDVCSCNDFFSKFSLFHWFLAIWLCYALVWFSFCLSCLKFVEILGSLDLLLSSSLKISNHYFSKYFSVLSWRLSCTYVTLLDIVSQLLKRFFWSFFFCFILANLYCPVLKFPNFILQHLIC